MFAFCDFTFSNSTFNSNGAILFGSDYGSTPITTSDTESDYTNRITVAGSTFSLNTATIFRTERYVKIDNCTFTDNTSRIGEFRGLNRYQVLNSTFTSNTGGNLFYFTSSLPTIFLANLGANNHLFDGNTFTGNTGTIINPGTTDSQTKATITNNIFSGNGVRWSGSPAVATANTFDDFISSISHDGLNNTVTVVMSVSAFNTNTGTGALELSDFEFALSGGNATLASSVPTSIAISGNTYVLGVNTTGIIDGTELLTVSPVVNSIYDLLGNIANTSQLIGSSNLVATVFFVTKNGGITTVGNANSVSKKGALGAGSAVNKNGASNYTQNGVSIGDAFNGGIVGYILQPGDPGYDSDVQHGIIVAPTDQSNGTNNGTYGQGIQYVTPVDIGSGQSNTALVAPNVTNGGVFICDNLSLNGYTDWFLPSRDELLMIYENRVIIGGFTISGDELYWTSSFNPTNANFAYHVNFTTGIASNSVRTNNTSLSVRAIRYF